MTAAPARRLGAAICVMAAVMLTTASGSVAAVVASASTTAPAVHAYSGVLPDGATWKAEIPAGWNGTLLLYSHGYLPTFAGAPNIAWDAPDPATGQALLNRGYGLAGSSYAAAGWALATAPKDQLDALRATIRAVGREPRRVLAFGSSMGGLVTEKLAETAGPRIAGALPTCGIVGGGEALGNYQLDGMFAIATLLAPGQRIKLVGFADLGEAFATTNALVAAVQRAQQTPAGRARVALVAAFYQAPTWGPGRPNPPAPGDAAAAEQGQYEWLLQTLQFTTPGRYDIEQAVGGNASWNKGVDYQALLRRSADRTTVRSLYRAAGLALDADLAALIREASTTADRRAVASMRATSVPTGRITMPVLSLHTTADQLVPVQHEEALGDAVFRSGRTALLRQAFVARQGHCNFTSAELVAGVLALDHRVTTGRWDGVADPQALQRSAVALGLGPAAYRPFRPAELLRETTTPPRRW